METEETQDDGVAVYRPPGRPGVGFFKVQMAADALLREGTRPTVEKIRARVGGSPNTIIVHLDKWWASLAKRIEIGSRVFERLPRPYALLAESFFHQSMEEFRKLAQSETGVERDAATAKADETRLRTLLLDERERELAEIVADRDNRIAVLETALAERTDQLAMLRASYQAAQRFAARQTTEIRRMHERHLLPPAIVRAKVPRGSRNYLASTRKRTVRPATRRQLKGTNPHRRAGKIRSKRVKKSLI